MQRFIYWWIRNAAYIGPVATSFSALAALCSVALVAWTFRQTRKDRAADLRTTRPRFRLTHEHIGYVTEIQGDPSITPFYSLYLRFENQNTNPAKDLSVRVHISGAVSDGFSKGPSKEFYQGDSLVLNHDLTELAFSNDKYFVQIGMTYLDVRTGERYSQDFWRHFYYQSWGGENPSHLKLGDVDRQDIESLRALSADSKGEK